MSEAAPLIEGMPAEVDSISENEVGRYRVETLRGFRSQALGNARDVRVAVLEEEAQRSSRPLLVINDGQDLEVLRILETLESLAKAGEIVAPTVVAIPTNRERMMEYGISGEPDSRGRGARADGYAQFVLEELLPAVRLRFGVSFCAEKSAILGASLGGLSAFDFAWRNPQVFGLCGVFSGSFWWRADSSSMRARQASRIAHRLVRETREIGAARQALRFWLQAGTDDESEDRDGNGVIDAIQDTTELMDELVARGWKPGRDLIYREVAGGRHEPSTWAAVFPEFARFAFV
jgi:iron(III)-enterobactin esterase